MHVSCRRPLEDSDVVSVVNAWRGGGKVKQGALLEEEEAEGKIEPYGPDEPPPVVVTPVFTVD